MPDERAILAISRIERALARIEVAAERPPPVAAHANGSEDELQQLRQQHRALRGKIEGAIFEIDRMLDGREGGY